MLISNTFTIPDADLSMLLQQDNFTGPVKLNSKSCQLRNDVFLRYKVDFKQGSDNILEKS